MGVMELKPENLARKGSTFAADASAGTTLSKTAQGRSDSLISLLQLTGYSN
jgi:hypothetical protein